MHEHDFANGSSAPVAFNNIHNWAYGFVLGFLINAARICMSTLWQAVIAALVMSESYDLGQLQTQRTRLDVINFLESSCYWQGYTFTNSKKIGSGWGIHKHLWFAAHINVGSSTWQKAEKKPGMLGDGIIVTVYRWRCASSIISDGVMKCNDGMTMDGHLACDPGNTVTVFRYSIRSISYIQTVTEVALPRGCPTLRFSSMIANQMVAWYKDALEITHPAHDPNENTKARGHSRVNRGGFVLAGSPGCGKSISARIFAFKLDAVLAYFNPSQGDVIDNFMEAFISSKKTIMVLVIEEVDTDLEAMLLAKQRKDKDDNSMLYTRSDALDKKAWCALFDRLQFSPNIIPVATTNKSLAWLQEFDKENFEGALFRQGRFGTMIDCDCVTVPPGGDAVM